MNIFVLQTLGSCLNSVRTGYSMQWTKKYISLSDSSPRGPERFIYIICDAIGEEMDIHLANANCTLAPFLTSLTLLFC